MNRFQILKNPTMEALSASMSFEDFQKKREDQKREAAERRLTPRQRQSNELIRQRLSTNEGRQNLASALSDPIRRQLDFSSIARRVFHVDPLPSGTLPIYERIENLPAFTANREGLNVVPVTEGRTFVPLFEISSHPEISLSQIRSGRFELIDRVQNQAAQSIASNETLLSHNILNAATTHTNQIIRPSEFNSSESILRTLMDAFTPIERMQLRVARIFSNPIDYSILQNNLRGSLDQTTHDELRESGLMGSLWGAHIITNPNIPSGEIYVTSEPEYLGVMPIRSDVTVLSANDPSRAMIGWSIFEEVGMAYMNPNAVTRISFNTPDRPQFRPGSEFNQVMEPISWNNPPYGESIIQRAMPLLLRSRFELLKET